ncbi:MAG: SCO family protein [Notoacmeibacter sp.]|nr:SCO family protein [Notoacmeibacter sp.]
MATTGRKWLAALFAAGLLALAGGGFAVWQKAGGGPGMVTSVASLGAPFELIDHDGKPISDAVLKGHPSLLYFGFTRCPEVCPTTLYEMSGWFEELGNEGKDIRAYFVTVDPERDDPETMKGYAEAFTDRVTGITGEPDKVFALLKAWRVYWTKVPTSDGDYTMDHTASVFMLGPDGEFEGTISYGEAKETALEKLRLLLKKSARSLAGKAPA